MTRPLRVAAVQVGRIDRDTPRVEVLARLTALLEEAASKGVQLAVFPEVTFTTFFPRYVFTPSEATELNAFYEVEDPETGIVGSTNVKAFFERANELGVDVVVGYAEKTPEGTPYNTASYVSKGKVVSKYRKVSIVVAQRRREQLIDLESRYTFLGRLSLLAIQMQRISLKSATSVLEI